MCVSARRKGGGGESVSSPLSIFRRGVEKLNRNDAKGYIVVQYTLYFSHLLFFFFFENRFLFSCDCWLHPRQVAFVQEHFHCRAETFFSSSSLYNTRYIFDLSVT